MRRGAGKAARRAELEQRRQLLGGSNPGSKQESSCQAPLLLVKGKEHLWGKT